MDIKIDDEMLKQLKGKVVLVKYGGNAMLNDDLKKSVIQDICTLHDLGVFPVIVHGGGPFIKDLLGKLNIHSEFIDGQRKTSPEAMMYIEMVLKGQVNSDLVKIVNSMGKQAVGLSGKDGKLAIAEKRMHKRVVDGNEELIDLWLVGDVVEINPTIVHLLLTNGFIPVIATVASGKDNQDYNINADSFAGELAGALKAEAYVALTDVDGLLNDLSDRRSLIRELNYSKGETFSEEMIKGGMIPKMDSCFNALQKGVKSVRIINGTVKNSLIKELLTHERIGTIIR